MHRSCPRWKLLPPRSCGACTRLCKTIGRRRRYSVILGVGAPCRSHHVLDRTLCGVMNASGQIKNRVGVGVCTGPFPCRAYRDRHCNHWCRMPWSMPRIVLVGSRSRKARSRVGTTRCNFNWTSCNDVMSSCSLNCASHRRRSSS
jgi:hypothetical protein